jgi:hypothetical protein
MRGATNWRAVTTGVGVVTMGIAALAAGAPSLPALVTILLGAFIALAGSHKRIWRWLDTEREWRPTLLKWPLYRKRGESVERAIVRRLSELRIEGIALLNKQQEPTDNEALAAPIRYVEVTKWRDEVLGVLELSGATEVERDRFHVVGTFEPMGEGRYFPFVRGLLNRHIQELQRIVDRLDTDSG